MRCFLNIGNTHTQILEAEPGGGRAVRTVATADFDPASLPDGAELFAACVVAEKTDALRARGCRMATPEAASKFVDFSRVDASTLGQDRVANAVYLAAKGVLPAVSLDFGTCITAEVVDAQRRFLGGAIFPGRTLARRALNLYTSKLPFVELADGLPPCPGANTADAIRMGTDAAAIDAVAGFLVRVEKKLGCRPMVYACGGDRAFFLRAPELAGMTDGGDDFTLRGVELLFS
ncbi:MAG: type III pantothenate kinase [Lentisphaeria bacterium]|nr:type III pantothenate kinase [Lentisphaeria bacterium]